MADPLKSLRSGNLKSGRRFDLHIVILLLAGFVVLLIKFIIACPIEYVGYSDAAAYAEMADSLIHGRGFEVDYISWYFLKYGPEISRPEDHWPPLYSIAIAPFFLTLGKTAFAAKLPSIIISCFLIPLVIYLITKELSGSRFAGIAAGLTILLYPAIFKESLCCLSDVLYTFIICASVLFSIKALDNKRFFYPMGIFIGLAYYAKGSGLVLIPGHILFHIIARRSLKKVFASREFLLSLLIAFLILLPWLARNYIHFGDPFFSTQRFVAGYAGYENWEIRSNELYWGERQPPSYFDKFKERLLFSINSDYQNNLDSADLSQNLYAELRKNGMTLSNTASISVSKKGSKWLIKDDQTYTVKKEGYGLGVYTGGIYRALKMIIGFLKGCIWLIFVDIESHLGKLSENAFSTYFVNIPAALGIFLLWGNRKRHAIWVIVGLMSFFLCIGWVPMRRLVLPMTCLMMPLGWATYFLISKKAIKLLSRKLHRLEQESRQDVSDCAVLEPSQESQESIPLLRRFISSLKTKYGPDILAGLLVCYIAIPVIMMSAGSIYSAYKKSGYPYRDAAWDCIDMGKWLRENASSGTITMTSFPWDLHFYSDQPAIQIPRASLEKTIGVMRFYKPEYILLESQLATRPSMASLMPLVTGEVPGLQLAYDNRALKLYKVNYNLLPGHRVTVR